MKDDPMNKFYLTLFALLLPLAVWAEAKKPNIIFIMADDLGWQDVSYMGADFFETPNIDRLAGQGMRFTAAYSGGTTTLRTDACLSHDRHLHASPSHLYAGR